MLQRPFRYDDNSMYVAVENINYAAESIVPGESNRLDGEGIKVQYICRNVTLKLQA